MSLSDDMDLVVNQEWQSDSDPTEMNSSSRFTTQSVKCNVEDCPFSCAIPEKLKWHQITVHNILPYQCHQFGCNKTFHQSAELTKHLLADHSDLIRWQCGKCSSHVKNHKYLMSHMRMYHGEGKFRCSKSDCDFTGTTRIAVVHHFGSKHFRLACRYSGCDKSYTRQRNLDIHERTHCVATRSYRCKWPNCNYTSAQHGPLTLHIRSVHKLPAAKHQKKMNIENKRETKQFVQVKSVIPTLDPALAPVPVQHANLLTQSPDLSNMEHFKQPISNQKTSDVHSFDQSTSTDANKYKNHQQIIKTINMKCLVEECPLKCVSTVLLNTHLINAHCILPYRCYQKGCNRSFYQKSELSHHFCVDHPSTTAWQCGKCEHFQPKDYNRLYHHMYRYHQLGKFQCCHLDCRFEANTRQAVLTHYRAQHVPRPHFTCTIENCALSFKCPSLLNLHQLSHMNIRPFRCTWPDCRFDCSTNTHIVRHIRVAHFGLPTTKKKQMKRNIVDNRNPKDFYIIISKTTNN